MTLIRRSAALIAITLLGTAAPALARPADHQPDVRASVCARDLGSAECGRYQHELIQATALRAGSRADAATLRETGRRQLDQLIDTLS